MPIPTHCPSCRARFALADELAGKTVRCQRCQTTFSVPQPEALPEAVPVVEPAEEAELVEPAVEPRQTVTAAALPAAPPRRVPVGEPAPRGPRPVGPPPGGGNGWMIGLIAGGAGLVLLVMAGLVVVWLLALREE